MAQNRILNSADAIELTKYGRKLFRAFARFQTQKIRSILNECVRTIRAFIKNTEAPCKVSLLALHSARARWLVEHHLRANRLPRITHILTAHKGSEKFLVDLN